MILIQTPDGGIHEYHLGPTPQGLRLFRACASYELGTMLRDAGWTIIGVRTETAKRLLARAGLLPEPSALGHLTPSNRIRAARHERMRSLTFVP
jgi:hypothetical protein